MFSRAEKQFLAAEVEKLLLGLNHPEMPKENVTFHLNVHGKAEWSWANIVPNWSHEKLGTENPNEWNEIAREILNEA